MKEIQDMKETVLGDDIGLARSNPNNNFGFERSQSLRLNTLINRLGRLCTGDEQFNHALDKLTCGEIISPEEFNSLIGEIKNLDENEVRVMGENKKEIETFFDSIKNFIVFNTELVIKSVKGSTEKLIIDVN